MSSLLRTSSEWIDKFVMTMMRLFAPVPSRTVTVQSAFRSPKGASRRGRSMRCTCYHQDTSKSDFKAMLDSITFQSSSQMFTSGLIIIIIISDIYIAQFLYEYTQLRITSSLTYYYPGFSRAAYGRS